MSAPEATASDDDEIGTFVGGDRPIRIAAVGGPTLGCAGALSDDWGHE